MLLFASTLMLKKILPKQGFACYFTLFRFCYVLYILSVKFKLADLETLARQLTVPLMALGLVKRIDVVSSLIDITFL